MINATEATGTTTATAILPPEDRPELAAAVEVDKEAELVALVEAMVEAAVFVVEASVCVCVTTTTVEEELVVGSATEVVEDVEDVDDVEDVEVVWGAVVVVEVDDVVDVGTEVVEEVEEVEVGVEVVDGVLVELDVLLVLLVVGTADEEDDSVVWATKVESTLVVVLTVPEPLAVDMAKKLELTSAMEEYKVQRRFLEKERVGRGCDPPSTLTVREVKSGTNRNVAPGALRPAARIGISKSLDDDKWMRLGRDESTEETSDGDAKSNA
jgi:hypothetical protein